MPNFTFTTDVYFAIQLQTRSTATADEGWVRSGCDYAQTNVQTSGSLSNEHACLPINTHAKFPDAPKIFEAYAQLLNCTMEVSQEYAGINSSGGPQVAGRANHSDVVIERYCDRISPYLFQYCATAWQIPKVYIIRYIGSSSQYFNFCHEWVLTGVQVTDYKYDNDRYYNPVLGITYLSSIETFSLLYTSAKYRCSKFDASSTLDQQIGEYRGWDTATNTGIGIPS